MSNPSDWNELYRQSRRNDAIQPASAPTPRTTPVGDRRGVPSSVTVVTPIRIQPRDEHKQS
jgi:hypothetical protein